MKTTKILTLLFIAFLAFTACKKTETGPQGPAGPQGAPGTNGSNGNANVFSGTFTTTAWQFVAPSLETNITCPLITEAILNKGIVLIYLQSGSEYKQLPFTIYPTSTYSRSYNVSHYVGGFKVYITDSDQTQPPNPGQLVYKVVVAESINRIKNIDLSDHKAVISALKTNS